jgi:hypothetical protein
MMSYKTATRLILGLLLVALPATATWATTRAEAEEAIAEAKAVREKAAAAGIDETQSAEMIAEAQSLMPSRQYTKARMIAYWAIRQDEFALSVQSGDVPAEQDKAAMAESLIAAAEEARKKADSVGGEWRDTASMIKNARTLAGAGEYDKAIEAASAAKFQAERGYEQAIAEKDAGFPDYMYDAVE